MLQRAVHVRSHYMNMEDIKCYKQNMRTCQYADLFYIKEQKDTKADDLQIHNTYTTPKSTKQ